MNKKAYGAIAALLLAGGTAAVAQTVGPIRPQYQYPGTTSQAGPAGVRLGDGPLIFSPSVSGAAGHDDNLFSSNTLEKSSALYIISPALMLEARGPSSVFQSSYVASIGRYVDSEDDSYVDQTFRNTIDFYATRETAVRIGYDYLRGHDPRGSTDRPFGNSPDKFRLTNPNGMIAFGQAGAQGRVELYGSNAHKRYLSNRDFTFAADRNTFEYGGAFYWRVMPRTQVLVEARHTEIDYIFDGSPLSGEEDRIYLGVTWDATAATSGTIKAGQLKKRFDSGAPSFDGTSWEGLVTWQPRTYSKFDVYTYRQPVESSGLGTFILSEAVGVIWSHAWSSYLTTEVNAKFQKDKYQQFPRTDDLTAFGAKVGYKFRRWLTLGAEWQFTNRDSNQSIYEYDRNLWLITATASL